MDEESSGESQLFAKARESVHRPFRRSCWVVIGVLAFVLAGPIGAPAAAGTSVRAGAAATATGDRAATHTLLIAEYRRLSGVS